MSKTIDLSIYDEAELADLLQAVTREIARRKPGRWIVYRHGWNAANQSSRSCPHRMELGRVSAESEEEARASAAAHWTCYNGQFFFVANEAEVLAAEVAHEAHVEDLVDEE